MNKPKGYFKRIAKTGKNVGKMVTHPIMPKGESYRAPPMNVYVQNEGFVKKETKRPETIWGEMDREEKAREEERAKKREEEKKRIEREREVKELAKRCANKDPVEAACARAEFKREFPSEYEQYVATMTTEVRAKLDAWERTLREKAGLDKREKLDERETVRPEAVVTIEENSGIYKPDSDLESYWAPRLHAAHLLKNHSEEETMRELQARHPYASKTKIKNAIEWAKQNAE